MSRKNNKHLFCIIIPTHNACPIWVECLEALKNQSISAEYKIVIDSSSVDRTVELAELSNFEVQVIAQSEFGHGKTRQLGLRKVFDCDVVVYLTQDACLKNDDTIEKLLNSFKDEKVAAVYGRQVSRKTAGVVERFERQFNYPSESSIKGKEDSENYGLKTAFISNSFAAYRLSALKEVGGFPSRTILAEDMYVGAKMLLAGWKIAYCAEAEVYHSHDYSILQTFRRYFDTGVFHAREAWIRDSFGGTDSEGLKFIRAEFFYLLRYEFSQIPYALLKNIAKYSGFRIGMLERYIPVSIKRILSMHRSFWD